MSPDVLLADAPEPTVLRRSDLQDLPVVDFSGTQASQAGSPEAAKRLSVPASRELDEAFQQGWDAGNRAAIESTEAASALVVDALHRAAETVEIAHERQLGETSALAVDLALELAALILRREVTTAVDPGRDAILRCLDGAMAGGPVTARLNPDDVARLGVVENLDRHAYTVIADPAVLPGDAIVDVDGGRVDGAISNALARVSEVLRP